jgi:hypothetical protein
LFEITGDIPIALCDRNFASSVAERSRYVQRIFSMLLMAGLIIYLLGEAHGERADIYVVTSISDAPAPDKSHHSR